MNVEIGTETPLFLFREYLFQIFGLLSLQCTELKPQVNGILSLVMNVDNID
jgi:hypothetical protein